MFTSRIHSKSYAYNLNFYSGLLIAILILMAACTVYDISCDAFNCKYSITHSSMNWSVALYSFLNSILDQKRQPLLMFSIYTNGKKIFACENAQSPNVIQCLHGIRSLATMWVIAGHTFVISIILPSRDFAEFIEVIINYCYDYFLVSGIYSKKNTEKKL